MPNYKLVELDRYNKRSENILKNLDGSELNFKIGAEGMSPIFRNPYLFYEKLIKEHSFKKARFLDVCCGDGSHSFTGAIEGASVVVSDIAENSVKLVLQKAKSLNIKIEGKVADADSLPFKERSFDVITCAGSLSYVNINLFIPSLVKILDENGVFIAVDSYNYNPFYKFNRFVHYLKGNRTWTVNNRIPDDKTIDLLRKNFKKVEIKYFDIFLFIAPILKLFINEFKIAEILAKLDNKYSFLQKFAFKIVIIAHK